ncbi:cutinase family protein [Tsukamurella strandjordii]|uniref:Cutinase family protein n=1 Tax=Tsukamurella strandjordii TaxID=147577 RepID=A0AA90NLP5_9ACTN|nr:cutinase family protein [Tsukamurella strandjordii]MDP0399974.1 cutinase family protein [Tsukamurella strandjordii]
MTQQQPGPPPADKRGISPLTIGVGIAVLIAVILVIILLINLLKPGPTPPVIDGPGTSSSGAPSSAVRPKNQPADCPDVQVISVPGTWESKSNDDPYRPTANPNSLMLKVTGPLAAAFPGSRADVWTTPYVAQLSNPVAIPPDGQASYEKSRTEGYDKSVAQITKVYNKCKLTGFVLMGFSQGAVIAGDIAGEIAAGKGPIPAENVLGVGLISDPRREPGDARTTGPNPPGVGVEVAYGGFSFGSLALRGKREGGFGVLKDRTYSLCGMKDPICNQPKDIFQAGQLATTLPELQKVLTGNSHALYATTTDWSVNGQTATQWLQGWARGVIDRAPKPPHS